MTVGDRRYGTYAVMAWLAELDLTVLWGAGKGAKSRSATTRAVLQTVANFVNEENAYWGGNEKISAHCDNRSKQTIQDHLERAARVGLLTKQRVMLGTRRGKDRITFHVELTQEQLVANAAAYPWTPRARRDDVVAAVPGSESDRIAELEAEIRRLREGAVTAETSEGMTVIPSQNDAAAPVDNSASSGAEGMTGHPFRRDDGSSLPLVTSPRNQSSSSRELATDGAGLAEEDEDSSEGVDDDLRRVHPLLSENALALAVHRAGVDPSAIDLVAAATEVVEARLGHRIGSPAAYVAAAVAAEPWRWPVRPFSWPTSRDGASLGAPAGECTHRWAPGRAGYVECVRCGVTRAQPEEAFISGAV